ncbi:recombinase family protein [Sphingomicrobium sp. XHP0235]|uniref:recombinase zinc beta ribbon domain-containing protein n=1 Tax=Sphingomicrobium aquimarinum TaxID=3133971 RepID=UPI0031FE88FA
MTKKSIQYARWSDPSQAKGNSKARQFGKMREEAEAQGYVCVREVFDDGRSAYHGDHLLRGNLGELLSEIECGSFIGWVLQVENIDRLTRQGYDAAFDLIRRITRAGMAIHTCDGDHFNANESVALTDVITLAVKADLARKEAEKRSERAKASWKIRREKAKSGEALPGAGPAWIRRVGKNNEVIQEYARQASRIWEIADETGHGAHTITRLLNKEGVKMFDTGKPWYQSRVDLILSGMEVIGYHQSRRKVAGKWVDDGEPIKVYPAIIPHDLFRRVRGASAARLATHGGGKSKRISNLLSGNLCKCAECGHSMRLAGSGNGYLMCSARDRGICRNSVAFPYAMLEKTVLDEFLHFAVEDGSFTNKSEAARMNELIARRETEHAVAVGKAEGLLSLAAQGSKMAVTMALEAEKNANAIAEELKALTGQKEVAAGRENAAEQISRLASVREKLSVDVDLRRKVQQSLNMLIDTVRFDTRKTASILFADGRLEFTLDLSGDVAKRRGIVTLNGGLVPSPGDPSTEAIVRGMREYLKKHRGRDGVFLERPEPAAA